MAFFMRKVWCCLAFFSILHETIFIKKMPSDICDSYHQIVQDILYGLLCKNENKSFRRILKCSQGENCVRISDQRFYCTLFFPCLQRSKACCLTIKSFCLLYMFTSSAKQAQVSPSSNSHIFATIFEGKIVVQTPAFPLDLETQH